MKVKNKNIVFICSVSEDSLKVVKYLRVKNEFLGFQVKSLSADIDDTRLYVQIHRLLKDLGYERNPVIFCLPRGQATCRYIKVPAQSAEEIENISSLQAPRFLPYPANELITGFQIASTDKEGYSDINLIIVRKNIIERYLKIFKELKAASIDILLSSFGLCNLYNYVFPSHTHQALIIDLDYKQAELAVVAAKKMVFSRSFKLDRLKPDWQELLADETQKTLDTYTGTVSQEKPSRIFLTGERMAVQKATDALNKQLELPVEALNYRHQINIPKELSEILDAEYSFASLIGLSLKEAEETINLLPFELRQASKKVVRNKKVFQTALLITVATLTWCLGAAKNLDNKAKYLARLKAELNKISSAAKPLEAAQKRYQFLQSRARNKPGSLDVLYELYQTVPSAVTLVSLNFEQGQELSLRGQAPELNSVFSFVGLLENSPVFKPFSVKVRYATKRKTQSGEIIDFEIDCLRK